MFISAHVPAGAVIGSVINEPITAFVAGFVSHLVMDALPHWGGEQETGYHNDEFLRVAKVDGIVGLVELAALVAVAGERRIPVMAGIAGACLPDMDKPFDIYLGFIPFPDKFNEFHKNVQDEKKTRMKKDIAVVAGLTLASAIIVQTLGKR